MAKKTRRVSAAELLAAPGAGWPQYALVIKRYAKFGMRNVVCPPRLLISSSVALSVVHLEHLDALLDVAKSHRDQSGLTSQAATSRNQLRRRIHRVGEEEAQVKVEQGLVETFLSCLRGFRAR